MLNIAINNMLSILSLKCQMSMLLHKQSATKKGKKSNLPSEIYSHLFGLSKK